MSKEQVLQTIPPEKTSELVPLEGLYLQENLLEQAKKRNRPLVWSGYVTDIHDVIATRSSSGPPGEIKNPNDWRLFQELIAQAQVVITGTGYMQRVEQMGEENAQNVLSQFNEGAAFANLGDWRLHNGFDNRNPDIAVVSRSLEFKIPEALQNSDRKIIVFTTHEMFESEAADELRKQGAEIVAAGVDAIDGKVMIDHLYNEYNYQTMMMTTGPSVLNILLEANVLNRLYITQVDREIAAPEDDKVTVLRDGQIKGLDGFQLTHEYLQKNATMDDGEKANQYFRLYEHKNI